MKNTICLLSPSFFKLHTIIERSHVWIRIYVHNTIRKFKAFLSQNLELKKVMPRFKTKLLTFIISRLTNCFLFITINVFTFMLRHTVLTFFLFDVLVIQWLDASIQILGYMGLSWHKINTDIFFWSCLLEKIK